MNPRLKALSEAGVSIWLDDLSRSRITTGNLAQMIEENSVVGVTTNPTIFAAALTGSDDYTDALKALGPVSPAEAIKKLWATDVQDACDMFADLYAATGGFNGRVSIEVEPGLANDAEGTIAQAQELYDLVGRENVLIKIPATKAGIPAIAAVIGRGISVNVTLIFSVERYREVMDAYLTGLETAAAAGLDLSKIHSVASFFISRVDTEIDKRLEAIGSDEALALRGKAAIANGQVAYAAYEEVFASDRWKALQAQGANVQRPLWASTGTKNATYSDTLYVSELVAKGIVNTMPEKTLLAFADHGEIGQRVEGTGAAGQQVLDAVAAQGIDLADAFEKLETEGVDKFISSWDNELVASVIKAQEALK